jgi:hypothetical protein
MKTRLIAEMIGVREYAEEGPVELHERDGRPVLIASNEGGYNCTIVDVWDLLDWLRDGPPGGPTDDWEQAMTLIDSRAPDGRPTG